MTNIIINIQFNEDCVLLKIIDGLEKAWKQFLTKFNWLGKHEHIEAMQTHEIVNTIKVSFTYLLRHQISQRPRFINKKEISGFCKTLFDC